MYISGGASNRGPMSTRKWVYILVTICVVLIFLYQIHKITCSVWLMLCSDWISNFPLMLSITFASLDTMPERVRSLPLDHRDHSKLGEQCRPVRLGSNISYGPVISDSHTNVSSGNTASQIETIHPDLAVSTVHSVPAKSPKFSNWYILLATQKSGSTWVQMSLDLHPTIVCGRERILDFHRECDARSKGCSWDEYRRTIEAVFEEYATIFGNSARSRIMGFNIQLDQIPYQYRQEFADWVYCNGISIVHLIRSSAIESFWTLQAQTYDTLQLGQYVDNTKDAALSTKLKSNDGIVIDVDKAEQYVQNLNSLRQQYRKLLKFYPRGIHYHEVYYEDLLLPSKNAEGFQPAWWALQSFLGAQPMKLGTRSGMQKLHTTACVRKISNWDQVKKRLKGTETALACELIYMDSS